MSEIIPPLSSTTDFYRPMEVFVVRPPKPRYGLHALLLLATVFSTLVVGARMEFNFQHNQQLLYVSNDSFWAFFPVGWALHPANLALGIPFSFTLMLILFAHEMGHYLYCRRYGVYATLPFFIPAPTFIGTLGAFIWIRSPIRSRTQLFDIGIAGPIAGFVVALSVMFVALGLSKTLPSGTPGGDLELGYPMIFVLVHRLMTFSGIADGLPAESFHGVLLHPTAMAAWVGMFATALNLLPGGQLDGGHIVFALAPRAHKTVSRLTIVSLLVLSYYCSMTWFLWAVLLRLSGMRHPVVTEWPPMGSQRQWFGVAALAMLLLTFTPTPFLHTSLREIIRGG